MPVPLVGIPSTPILAVAAGSTLNGFNDAGMGFQICTTRARIVRQNPIEDVTQQGDTDTYGTPEDLIVTAGNFRATRRWVMRLQGEGIFRTSGDAGATWDQQYAGPSSPGGVTGAVHARVMLATIARNMELRNITSANDAIPKSVFTNKKVEYGLSIAGVLTASETPLNDDPNLVPLLMTLPFGTSTVAGKVVFDNFDQSIHFDEGGPHDLVTPARFTGPVTKANTPFDILAFDAELDLSNGQTLTGQAILETLQTTVNYMTSGVIRFSYDGVISDFEFS